MAPQFPTLSTLESLEEVPTKHSRYIVLFKPRKCRTIEPDEFAFMSLPTIPVYAMNTYDDSRVAMNHHIDENVITLTYWADGRLVFKATNFNEFRIKLENVLQGKTDDPSQTGTEWMRVDDGDYLTKLHAKAEETKRGYYVAGGEAERVENRMDGI